MGFREKCKRFYHLSCVSMDSVGHLQNMLQMKEFVLFSLCLTICSMLSLIEWFEAIKIDFCSFHDIWQLVVGFLKWSRFKPY